jgi:hypothetical protein
MAKVFPHLEAWVQPTKIRDATKTVWPKEYSLLPAKDNKKSISFFIFFNYLSSFIFLANFVILDLFPPQVIQVSDPKLTNRPHVAQ